MKTIRIKNGNLQFQKKSAEDYVTAFRSVATDVPTSQKNALVAFIETLMNNGLWGKVSRCYPMLGSLASAIYDLKTAGNAIVMPSNAISFDTTRNAPHFVANGLNSGTSEIPFDFANGSVFLSFKYDRTKGGMNNVVTTTYSYGNDYYGLSFSNYPSGNSIPNNRISGYFITNSVTGTSSSYAGYSKTKNTNSIISLRCNGTSMFCDGLCNSTQFTKITTGKNNNDAIWNEATAPQSAQFILGGYFAASDGDGDADGEFNGNINMLLSFNCCLTDEETAVVLNAIDTLDVALGRHTDFD